MGDLWAWLWKTGTARIGQKDSSDRLTNALNVSSITLKEAIPTGTHMGLRHQLGARQSGIDGPIRT